MVRWYLLLVVCLAGASAKRRRTKEVNQRKKDCERDVCADVHPDQRPNCNLKCQSEACYEEIYGKEELEPGEIDSKRQREFTQCQNRESRERLKQSKAKGRRRNDDADEQEQADDNATAAEDDLSDEEERRARVAEALPVAEAELPQQLEL
ncbi:hypothetical protein AB1Y20_007387 [Prymnesium parvum]|uniref:Uncharacterized protein n=1 Tax=Prymnesium parvum TaxID=97485 RepID=A0AB34IX15_PRYPA